MSNDRAALRNMRGFERDYLRALVNRFDKTPALLVKQESTRRSLKLLEAYCPLTLKPDRDDAEPGAIVLTGKEQPIEDLERSADSAIDQLERVGRRVQLSFKQRMASVLLAGLFQLVLALVVVLSIWLLLAPIGGEPSDWLRVGGAIIALGAWLFAARWLYRQLIGRRKIEHYLIWREQRNQCIAQPGTPGAEVWAHERLLVRGEPGSGKTTLLRHMAVICARDRLGLAQRQNRDRVRDVYGWPLRLFPIYVPLRALTFSTPQDDRPFLERYAEILPNLFLSELPGYDPSYFVSRVKRGGCLILIDAFDELPGADARNHYSELIAGLARIPSRKPNRIVVTSRIVGYEGQLDDVGFVRRRVAELVNGQVAEFITGRYTAIMAPDSGSPKDLPNGERVTEEARLRATDLIERLPENPGLRRLSRNPLLLALAVAVHYDQRDRGGTLPQERTRLYEEALKLLVSDWEQRKNADFNQTEADSPFSALSPDHKMHLLGELAWSMFEHALSQDDGHAHAVVEGSQARKVLAPTLVKIFAFAPDKVDQAREVYCQTVMDEVLRRINQSGGVLQERGNIPGTSDVQIQFAHLTFQEYLAARAARSEDPDQHKRRRARLLEHWNDPRLREVVLMYAAISDATPVVSHLLAQDTLEGKLMAGAILNERGRNLDPQQLSKTLGVLRTIALEDEQIEAATAVSALRILYPLVEKDQQSLIAALASAPHPDVRTQLIALLAGLKCNQVGVPIEPIAVHRNGHAPAVPIARQEPAPIEREIEEALLGVLERERDYRPRAAAGFALARRDPRYAGDGWRPELVEVPAGAFLMGSATDDPFADGDEKPQHSVEIPYAYRIGRTPVTIAQWRHFASDGGYDSERYWTRAGWRFVTNQLDDDPGAGSAGFTRFLPGTQRRVEGYRWHEARPGQDNLPITNITWFEAVAYCRWLSEKTNQLFYLPSEAEWEKAARGSDGRFYPWGSAWQSGCCNSSEAGMRRTSPVGSFATGASPYRALDMAGNVYEWCATRYRKAYPYALGEEWSEIYLEGLDDRMARGGAYTDDQRGMRAAYRYNHRPQSHSADVGLRVASRTESI